MVAIWEPAALSSETLDVFSYCCLCSVRMGWSSGSREAGGGRENSHGQDLHVQKWGGAGEEAPKLDCKSVW